MPFKNPYCLFITVILSASLPCGCAWFSPDNTTPPEGVWACSAQWNYDRNGDGVSVPVTVSVENLCERNELSSRGQVSIGDAQWTEVKKGTCYASGDELYGKWISSETTAANEAARKFETEVLEGKSLGDMSTQKEKEYRVRIQSRTDDAFAFVNEDGRNVHCSRL